MYSTLSFLDSVVLIPKLLKSILYTLFIVSLSHISIVLAEPIAWDGPSGDSRWYTITSDHFQVHYADIPGWDKKALKVLEDAEWTHDQLIPFFRSIPERKTQIVLSDDKAIANGWASPFPYPQIRIFLSHPKPISGLEYYDDWIRSLLLHEYVHVLHTELSNGLPKTGQSILGRNPLFFPHSMTPPLIIEGLAVYLESQFSATSGRLNSSYYKMQMRSEIADNSIDDLDLILASGFQWPFGKAYLYGGYFIEYIVETYGEDYLRRYLIEYSSEIVPWILQDETARQVFGKSFTSMWVDFENYLKVKFSDSSSPELTSPELTSPELTSAYDSPNTKNVIPKCNQYTSFVCLWQPSSQGRSHIEFSHAGRYQYASNGTDRPELRFYPERFSSNKEQSALIVRDQGLKVLEVNDNDIWSIRNVSTRSGQVYGDLFKIEDRKWKRLTHSARWSDVKVQPSGEYVWLLRQHLGMSQIWRYAINSEGSLVDDGRCVLELPENWSIGSFDINNRGELILSVKEADGFWDLWLWRPFEAGSINSLPAESFFNSLSTNFERLTQDVIVQHKPLFVDDDNVLFISDADNYRIRRLSIINKSKSTITTDIDAIIDYSIIPGLDEIVIKRYTAAGYNWYRHPVSTIIKDNDVINRISSITDQKKHTAEVSQSQKDSKSNFLLNDVSGVENISIDLSEYNAFSYLAPTSWLPLYSVDSQQSMLGFQIGGMDALQRHQFLFNYRFDFKNDIHETTLNYIFNGRWNGYFNRSHRFINLDPLDPIIVAEDEWGIQLNDIWTSQQQHWSLHAGLVGEREHIIDVPQDVVVEGRQQLRQYLLGTAIEYQDIEFFRRSPGIGWGTQFQLVIENQDLIDDDFEGWQGQYTLQKTFDLLGARSLSLQARGGIADELAKPFRLGGAQAQEEGRRFGRERLSLPGYRESSQFGNQYERYQIGYRQKLVDVNRNLGLWPIGLGTISTNIKLTSGRVWFESFESSPDYLHGLSFELHAQVLLGYRVPVPVVLGAAHGLDSPEGDTEGYISVGFSF